MNTTTPTRAIPEALGEEDGERWFVLGHIEPALMVLAVMLELATSCGAEEMFEGLTGQRPGYRYTPGVYAAMQQHAESLLGSVRHVWFKPDPDDDDDEKMVQAVEGEPGAEPWTELHR